MQAQQAHPGVILLTQNLSSADLGSVRAWFEESDFNLCEAKDVFQAIEQLSDFTQASRPDVVLLEANCPDIDFAVIRELAADASAGGEASVFSFTHGSQVKSVSNRLDSIFQDMTICH